MVSVNDGLADCESHAHAAALGGEVGAEDALAVRFGNAGTVDQILPKCRHGKRITSVSGNLVLAVGGGKILLHANAALARCGGLARPLLGLPCPPVLRRGPPTWRSPMSSLKETPDSNDMNRDPITGAPGAGLNIVMARSIDDFQTLQVSRRSDKLPTASVVQLNDQEILLAGMRGFKALPLSEFK